MVKIGLVTVTFNSSKVLDGFLASCLSQRDVNFILYVVDSGSTDDSLHKLAQYNDSRLVVIPSKSNIGFAAGSNLGMYQAVKDGCQSICLINNDTEFPPNLFSILSHKLNSENVDMVVPKMMYFEPNNKIWYAGGTFKKNHEYKVVQYGENELDTGQYNQMQLCDFAPMCCVLFKKECFEKIGYLDEKYFVYSEDADWFLRARQQHLKLLYIPEAILYHKVSSLTAGPSSPFSARYGTRNKVYLIRKNFKGLTKLVYLTEYFLWIFIGFIIRKFTFAEFRLKLPAFFRGLFY